LGWFNPAFTKTVLSFLRELCNTLIDELTSKIELTTKSKTNENLF
jgi:hypothetical protein